MAERAKASLGVDQLGVVADMGYYDGAEVKKCEAQGITVYLPKPNTSANTKLGLFGKERFHYEADKDVYRCPAGQELTYRLQRSRKAARFATTRLQRAAVARSSHSARVPGQSTDHPLGVRRRAGADATAGGPTT